MARSEIKVAESMVTWGGYYIGSVEASELELAPGEAPPERVYVVGFDESVTFLFNRVLHRGGEIRGWEYLRTFGRGKLTVIND